MIMRKAIEMMRKYIIFGLGVLAVTACSQNEPTQTTVADDTATGFGFTTDIDINNPKIQDLEDGEFRTLQHTYTATSGYPRISFLPKNTNRVNFVQLGNATPTTVNIRWRWLRKSAPNAFISDQSLAYEGIAFSYNANGLGHNGVATEAYAMRTANGGERLRIYYHRGNVGTNGWWGTADYDFSAIVTYGVFIAKGTIPNGNGMQKIKFYYHAGYVPSSDTNGVWIESGYNQVSGSNATSTTELPRKLYFTTESIVNSNTYYPMMTRPQVARRFTSTEIPGTTTQGTYSFASIDNRTLDARGTLLALAFKNETGGNITILDLVAKNDGLAYSGYFSYAPKSEVGNSGADGIAPAGVMTGDEVKAGTPLKFVETNIYGFSQYTLDNITNTPKRPIDTEYTFGLYATPTATTQGLTLASGAVTNNTTNGRVFLWGFPKNNGTTPITVRVKYRKSDGSEVYSKPQTIVPPTGGFKETTAYLKTIRIVAPPLN